MKSIKYTFFLAQFFWVGLLYLYFVEKDFLVTQMADRITIERELDWGEQVFEEHREEIGLMNDPYLDDQLNRLLRPLEPALQGAPYPIQFHLSYSPQVNAYALPGAHVVINAGLILECQSAEELLAVIAHEAGHVLARHNLEQWIYQAGFMSFFGQKDKKEVQIAFALSAFSYSRKHELEADTKAIELLKAARVPPRGLEVFLKRIQGYEQEQGSYADLVALFSTHPATQDRIDLIRNKLSDFNEQYYAVPFDYPGFQHMVRTRLQALIQQKALQ